MHERTRFHDGMDGFVKRMPMTRGRKKRKHSGMVSESCDTLPNLPNPTQPNPTQPNPTQPNPTQPNPTQPNPTHSPSLPNFTPSHFTLTPTHPTSRRTPTISVRRSSRATPHSASSSAGTANDFNFRRNRWPCTRATEVRIGQRTDKHLSLNDH